MVSLQVTNTMQEASNILTDFSSSESQSADESDGEFNPSEDKQKQRF